MKKLFIMFVAVSALFLSTSVVNAQFNPYSENTKMLTAGFGLSGYGVPIFARFELPVANNITVGGGVSYQSYSRTGWGGSGFSILGIHARGSYHFNELFEIDSNQWDVYGGANLGYYSWNTPSGYIGNLGGFGVGIQIGGRYFFTDKLGINLELGGGSVVSNSTLGLTIAF